MTTGAGASAAFWPRAAGEGGLLLRFGTAIDEGVSNAVLRALHALDAAAPHDGVREVLPAFASLLVHYDPLRTDEAAVLAWCRAAVAACTAAPDAAAAAPRTVTLPVRYGGVAGPDIDDVARQSGLASADAVAAAHASGTYRVYFLGFVGGFPYLGGLEGPLATVPRKQTPSARIAGGSVAVAGGQTGVYSISSPGGWNVIGRTTRNIFNPAEDPPALLRPGDLVRFEAAPDGGDAADHGDGDGCVEHTDPAADATSTAGHVPWITLVAPGLLTTVQDLGRYGQARHGVSRAGAADPVALQTGNAILGNPPSAAGLEVTMGGLKFTVAHPARVALTGADCSATVTRGRKGTGATTATPLPRQQSLHLEAGDEVAFGYAAHGMRAYVCVEGGVAVPKVLGSCSTDLRSAMGGHHRRALRAGDALARAEPLDTTRATAVFPVRYARYDPLAVAAAADGAVAWEVRVLPGPGAPTAAHEAARVDGDGDADFEALVAHGAFKVLPKSDRMAVCLAGGVGAGGGVRGGQQMSEGCVTGTVQVPPDGNPLILLAEHQTTGGYKVPAVVIHADMWKVAQMRPGDTMTFVPATRDAAVAALRRQHAEVQETCVVHPGRFARLPFTPRPLGDTFIDLNADAGEGFDDAGLLRYVSSVNIACGGHVGTPESIARTVALAAAAGAGIGAHPSYVDPENFGRKALDVPPEALREQVLWQVSGLQAVARAHGTTVRYIKPHGALYHAVLKGGAHGDAVLDAADRLGLPLLLMPTSSWATFGEGFAERAYDGDKLRPRDKPGAVIHDPALAAEQAVALAGRPSVHSICVHGDSPNAVNVARAVRAALDAHYTVRPFAPVPAVASTSAHTAVAARHWFLGPEGARATYEPVGAAGQRVLATIEETLKHVVAPVVVNGYRRGDGVDPDRYPTERVCVRLAEVQRALEAEAPPATEFTEYAAGRIAYDAYIAGLRRQLEVQGGGWVTVAPRDTCQQGHDSESACINYVSRLNAERWGVRAGCVGYEIGGAQYQAALMRGFDPAVVLALGLPDNLPAHSLQRAQYVNGLAELSEPTRRALFEATAAVVATRYTGGGADRIVPWMPYNFHAGNYINASTGYSPLDATTAELLDARCTPMPVWVFSEHFPLDALAAWTDRQIALFHARGRTLHCVRIKNPGHGAAWTAPCVWEHVTTIRGRFAAASLAEPIVYIHNHDFNGLGAHVAAALLRTAQGAGYPYLVVDAGYRKNGTHNDVMVVADALRLSSTQRDALREWSAVQQDVERVLCRFDSRDSHMTPWDSDWAGGTEGSDLRIAREYNLSATQINTAKEVASAVFPLERAVTPFSEYKLRLGIGIMIETGIAPKTPDAVRAWVRGGGKLKVGGPVLLGLERWETLAPRPPAAAQLLENMKDELAAARAESRAEITPDTVAHLPAAGRFTALGFQQKGLRFATHIRGTPEDLTLLLHAPTVLQRQGKTLPEGTAFDVVAVPGTTERVVFAGFEIPAGLDPSEPGATIGVRFTVGGKVVTAELGLVAVAGADGGGATADARGDGSLAVASDIPGEIVRYEVAPGDVLRAGAPMCVVESMKMEYVIAAPAHVDGRRVRALVRRPRSASRGGDSVKPGEALLEMHPAA